MPDFQIITGDALTVLRTLPEASVDCVVTSPPYWGLRDYGHAGQMGLEETPDAYVQGMVEVLREVRRVLAPQGTLWLNLGDSYAGSLGAQGRQGKTGQLAGRGACASRQIAAAAKREHRTGALDRTPGLKPKDLVGIPWRVAFALQADGWWLRDCIIWNKPNPMPSSVKDRTTTAHEYVFMLAKSARYFYDAQAIAEPLAESTLREITKGYDGQATKDYEGTGAQNPSAVKARIIAGKRGKNEETGDRRKDGFNERWDTGTPALTRNKRSVWTIPTQPFRGAHFATFPESLVEPCILAGCPEGGLVLDPFTGSGTTGAVALRHFRRFVGIELNPAYAEMATRRIAASVPGPTLFNREQASA